MTWPAKIERLRDYVTWECKDIPPDLALAIIKHESAGVPGRVGGGKTKPGTIPSVSGQTYEIEHAYGLMQAAPVLIQSWNERHTDSIDTAYLEDMSGNDDRAIRMQIRLGCYYLAVCCAGLHRFSPSAFPASSLKDADNNQIKLSLVAYAIGLGALKKKLNQLREQELPLTIGQLKRSYPNWGRTKEGKWINRPLHYATVVSDWYNANKSNSFDSPDKGKLSERVKTAAGKGGWILIPLLIAAGYGFYKHKKGRHENT